MTFFRVIFDEKTGQWAADITKKQHQNTKKWPFFGHFYAILPTRRVVVQIFIIKTTQNLAKIAQNAPLGANYDSF